MDPYASFYTPTTNSSDDLIEDLEQNLAALVIDQPVSLPVDTVTKTALPKEYVLNIIDDCPICSSKYKRKGDLKNHLISQHFIEESSVYFECSCGVRSSDQKKFTRHSKSCKANI